jgi:hypothetical protein
MELPLEQSWGHQSEVKSVYYLESLMGKLMVHQKVHQKVDPKEDSKESPTAR